MGRSGWLLAVILVLVACGGASPGSPTPSPTVPLSVEYDHRAGALIVQADSQGGLLSPWMGRHVPRVSIYGDGLVVLGGEEEFRGGVDRVVTVGHISGEELKESLGHIADRGFFELDDYYQAPSAAADLACSHVTVHVVQASKSVTVCPADYEGAPEAFVEVYNQVLGLYPSDAGVFAPNCGTMTATDLGTIDELPSGQRNQVAPWDTPLMGIALQQTTGGAYLDGEQYEIVEKFLVRYPPGQLFGSQEGVAYRVVLEAELPWEGGAR